LCSPHEKTNPEQQIKPDSILLGLLVIAGLMLTIDLFNSAKGLCLGCGGPGDRHDDLCFYIRGQQHLKAAEEALDRVSSLEA